MDRNQDFSRCFKNILTFVSWPCHWPLPPSAWCSPPPGCGRPSPAARRASAGCPSSPSTWMSGDTNAAQVRVDI